MTKSSVCIITGSGTGIGAACAIELAQRGWRVVVNYSKSRDAAETTADACRAAGGEALVVQANVTQDADCRRMTEVVLERWGRIDGLVNNAGTTKFVNHADLDGLNSEDFLSIYATNV